jgi:DNA helicase-4
VLDADEGCYPLVHPNWVFLRVFGDSIERIEAEERRLFYVALTRSRHSLVVLSDSPERESPYLIDIKAHMELASIAWAELDPVPSLEGARIEIRVSNAYDVHDQLKQLGYRWNAPARCWCRLVMAEGFDFRALCGQPWVQPGVRIEVCSESGKLLEEYGGPSVSPVAQQ